GSSGPAVVEMKPAELYLAQLRHHLAELTLGLLSSVWRTRRPIVGPKAAAATRKIARTPDRMPAKRATEATCVKRTAIRLTRHLIVAPEAHAATREIARGPYRMPAARATEATCVKRTAIRLTRH